MYNRLYSWVLFWLNNIMKKTNWIVPALAIAGLVAIEITALQNGIDGTLMIIIVSAIAGIAGYKLPDLIKK